MCAYMFQLHKIYFSWWFAFKNVRTTELTHKIKVQTVPGTQ